MQYLMLFLEGVITFISPCLLPMLPIYISYFAAGQADKRRTLTNALGFVLGFTTVFVALGAFAGTVGALLSRHGVAVNIVTGAIVILLGLNFMGVIRIRFLDRGISPGAKVKELKLFSSVIFGVVFAIGWTPCVGAFLGAALMRAAMRGGTLEGMAMLLVYSMGLGVPLILSAVLLDRLKSTFDFIKRNYRAVSAVSGGFLVVMGVLMVTGLMGRFMALLTL